MDIITLERYECTGCGKSIRVDDYCRCPVGQEKEIADARADHARADEIKAAEKAERTRERQAWLAEREAWEASPEGIAEEAAQEAEQERQVKAEQERKASKAPLPVQDDGLAMLRRQAAKEQANAAQDEQLADRERAVKDKELSRRERRATDDGDTTGPAGPADATLDDLAAVFDDEVDLTPTPAVLEREDNAMVLPAGKLNWVYGLPGCGKSFLCMIDMIEAVMRGGHAVYLDYEG